MANQIVGGERLRNETLSPFQSSSGMVNSCTNYYSMVQKGGNNDLEK